MRVGAVVVVLREAGRDRKHVRVEDDVPRREAHPGLALGLGLGLGSGLVTLRNPNPKPNPNPDLGPVRISYARLQMRILSSRPAAWPTWLG